MSEPSEYEYPEHFRGRLRWQFHRDEQGIASGGVSLGLLDEETLSRVIIKVHGCDLEDAMRQLELEYNRYCAPGFDGP